ncbi:hypothetical protein SAMN02990966_05998 [Rhodospirillales bacterium URHD0017]|nr:hypothetical protein SAMN02990966_05998 [Rhodospirillales bacterium URHD0017]
MAACSRLKTGTPSALRAQSSPTMYADFTLKGLKGLDRAPVTHSCGALMDSDTLARRIFAAYCGAFFVHALLVCTT